MNKPLSSYTRKLSGAEAETLQGLLRDRGYEFGEVPYSRYAASGRDVKVVMYESGKLVVQGAGTEEFVRFLLEPEVLKCAELGYEEILNPDMLLPRLGVDESGKGDVFGPLCVAGVYVNASVVRAWKESGVRDSKTVGTDKKIRELAETIRETPGCVWNVVVIGNEAYNRMIAKLGSVNKVLAWGHARVIENLLQEGGRMDPRPERAVIDQFAASENTVKQALMSAGRGLKLVQRHKAESDLAVAAASILAREAFINRLEHLGREMGVVLPKGAGREADEVLRRLAAERGGGKGLGRVVKSHFRNVLRLEHEGFGDGAVG